MVKKIRAKFPRYLMFYLEQVTLSEALHKEAFSIEVTKECCIRRGPT